MIFTDDQQQRHTLKVEQGTVRAFTTPYAQILLWKWDGVFHVRAQHVTRGVLSWAAFRSMARAHEEFNFLVEDWNMTGFNRTDFDLRFLTACGIKAESPDSIASGATPINYVLEYMKKNKIPLTKENYLQISFMGQEMPEELDGETEAELPAELQEVAEIESMTAGNCGEPSYTTPTGVPCCEVCGRSTRNRNAIVCSPCRKLLSAATEAAKKWYHQKLKLHGLGQEMNDALHKLNPAQQEKFCRRYKRITGRDFAD